MTGIALRDCGCGCTSCTGDAICPCEDAHGPWRIFNPSGLRAISYRVGDFASFRHELVRHLAGEQQLAVWRPTTDGDLALQIVDWFAIVADILTFYSERIANEAYLGTAVLPESAQRLVSLLGYRPRPGIGAVATLGVIASGPGPVVIPDRFQIASKARPGLDSQTFELTTGTTFTAPTSVPAPPPDDVDTASTGGGPPARLAAGGRRAAPARSADRPRRGARQGQAHGDQGRRPPAPDQADVDRTEPARRRRLGDGTRDRDRPARQAQYARAAHGHGLAARRRQGRRLRAQALDPDEPSHHGPERRRLDQVRPDRARWDRALSPSRRPAARRGAGRGHGLAPRHRLQHRPADAVSGSAVVRECVRIDPDNGPVRQPDPAACRLARGRPAHGRRPRHVQRPDHPGRSPVGLDRRRHAARHAGLPAQRAAVEADPGPGAGRSRRGRDPGARPGREWQRRRRHSDADRRIRRHDRRCRRRRGRSPDAPAAAVVGPDHRHAGLERARRAAGDRRRDPRRPGLHALALTGHLPGRRDERIRGPLALGRRLLEHCRADRRRHPLDRGPDPVRPAARRARVLDL